MGTLADINMRGLLADRPSAGIKKRRYYAEDEYTMYLDTGTEWQNIEGAAFSGKVAYSQLGRLPGCRIHDTGGFTLTTDTETLLTFNTDDKDPDGMHDTVSNTGRITLVTAGAYLFLCTVRWGANVAGYRQLILRRTRGSTATDFGVNKKTSINNWGDGAGQQVIGILHDGAVGDYVEVYARHTRGSNFTISFGAAVSPYVTCHYLGGALP